MNIKVGRWHQEDVIDCDLMMNEKGGLYWGFNSGDSGFTVENVGKNEDSLKHWKEYFEFEENLKNV